MTNKEDREIESVETTPEGIANLPTQYMESAFCNYWPGHVKISFAERIDGNLHYRVSILMEEDRVRALIKLLQDVLADMEPETKPKMEASKKG